MTTRQYDGLNTHTYAFAKNGERQKLPNTNQEVELTGGAGK